MAHNCNVSGIVVQEQPDGAFLMTMSTGDHSMVNCLVNYCCHCGTRAPTNVVVHLPPNEAQTA